MVQIIVELLTNKIVLQPVLVTTLLYIQIQMVWPNVDAQMVLPLNTGAQEILLAKTIQPELFLLMV